MDTEQKDKQEYPSEPANGQPGGPPPLAPSGLSRFAQQYGIKFSWATWSLGEKIIFVSGCVAAASMLLKWWDVGLLSGIGLFHWPILYLGVFGYPVLMVLKNKPVDFRTGIGCGAAGILLALYFIYRARIDFMGQHVSFAGLGPYVFLLASIGLAVGVYRLYQK
jgi:hypothetical protein